MGEWAAATTAMGHVSVLRTISSEAGLAHTGTIVHNQRLHVTVRHLRERVGERTRRVERVVE